MFRKIIKIDGGKCDGCGLCVDACQEGAIALVEGRARLVRDDYCDGLGNCLPLCPQGAITFEEREAAEFSAAAVKAATLQAAAESGPTGVLPCGCPGTQARVLERAQPAATGGAQAKAAVETQLKQWPLQLKLVPPQAPYFHNARLLVAADCAAYAYGNFHADYMKGCITLIGCPKLDEADYGAKLSDILKTHDIKSLTIARMEVPCCGGLEEAAKSALQNCGKLIPWQVVIISTAGQVLP
jgi:NAD-dependent dihydropyrimidine dehydrogenase PreA subunit